MDGQGRHGRRCLQILLSPSGELGTRWELNARFTSQRLWTDQKQAAHQRQKIIKRLEGVAPDLQWVIDHPHYKPRRRKLVRHATYDRLMDRYRQYQ